MAEPVIKIEYRPTVSDWAEMAEAIWVTALEGGCNYWCDYIHTGGHDLKDGMEIFKNFPIVVHHNGDWDDDSETIEAKSFDVIWRGIDKLDAQTKMQIGDPRACDIDAEIADRIIQGGLFGEVIYG